MEKQYHFKTFSTLTASHYILGGLLFVSLAGIIFVGYKYYSQNLVYKQTQMQLASTTEATTQNIEILRLALLSKNNENKELSTSLLSEQERNNIFGAQVESLSNTVGLLDKLSKTDKELLQKYSNIYFLNENYTPSALSAIDPAYLYRKEKSETIHTNIKPFLEAMIQAATNENQPILVLSGYRSFNTQAALKTGYKVTYGTTAANKFSADQGYSEHQLGSTIDFTTPLRGETLQGFDKTTQYTWLLANAHKYGFILSYPKGNKFYQFEPWHWRFVGVELATKFHNENKTFYTTDQREINEFLVKIFD
jgi:LAS superfamily LD-carboxypeptidase LdcB